MVSSFHPDDRHKRLNDRERKIFSTSRTIFTLLNLFLLSTPTSGNRCKEQCSSYIPQEHHLCKEIQQAWETTHECVAECTTMADYQRGLIIGQCLASWDRYRIADKCGHVENYPGFPSSEELLCGVEPSGKFSVKVSADCRKLLPVFTCDGKEMKRFMDCVFRTRSGDDFTLGVVKAGCDYYSVRGVKCGFTSHVCTFTSSRTMVGRDALSGATSRYALNSLLSILVICSMIVGNVG